MPDLDEHMDELFRKAAGNYMLKEGESHWAEISAQFEPKAVAGKAVKKNNAKRYILMAMLMLLFFIAGDLFHNYNSNRKTTDTRIWQEETTDQVDKTKEIPLNEEHTRLSKDALSVSDARPKIVVRDRLHKKSGSIPNNNNLSIYSNNKQLVLKQITSFNSKDGIKNVAPLINNNLNNIPAYNKPVSEVSKDSILRSEMIADVLPEKDTATNNQIVSIVKPKKSSGFYVGLSAGVGFNSVKHQGLSKPGLDVGLLAGYQINKRASLETGILYSRRNYYTDGKYFSMYKVGGSMPTGMKVVSLKGKSSLFEMPVKFKYNIITKNNNSIYGAAGFSSFLLTNEKNDYTTSYNNAMGNMKSLYKDNEFYFAGAINASVGYEHSIGKNGGVRVEPYIQIPTKGIGVGKLPVATSGVHISFTLSAR